MDFIFEVRNGLFLSQPKLTFMKTFLFVFLFITTAFSIKGQTSPSDINNHGKYVMYYKTGSIKAKGKYLNDKREGEWIFFHENGNIALKKNFSKGVQVGEWIYYNPDGTLAMKVDDISKVDEKVDISLYENNKVKYKSTFVNGRKVSNTQTDLNKKF